MHTVIASKTVDLPGKYNRRVAEKSTVRLLNNQFVLLYFIKLERNTNVFLLTGPIDSETYECIS